MSADYRIDPSQLQEFAVFADAIVRQARAVTLDYFRRGTDTEIKDDGSPVTVADRQCESLIRSKIAQMYPHHGVRGEEFSDTNASTELTWVIDPIDGTKSFISGAPTYGTLLALLHNGVPVLGVIDIPAIDERWSATRHTPTIMNGQPVKTQHDCQLSSCILTVISPDRFDNNEQSSLSKLSAQVGVYRYTSDGYAYGLLASGYIGLVVAARQQAYDYLPVVNVIERAGGCITDWQGDALNLESDGRVIAAANPALHQQAIKLLHV